MLQHAHPLPRRIRDGDLAIVYEGFNAMKAITVDASKSINNHHGRFDMKDWVGRPFGCRVSASGAGGGWLHVLAPTPELWTAVLRHRTQILYVADIAAVVSLLELRPGAVVAESGTGSGSLTASLARAVAPGGRVHTFDFHAGRAAAAAAEFAAGGLGAVVAPGVRDVEAAGFPAELDGAADAVFLDLPAPWRAAGAAARALRADGVACSFSPCIEQVQRACGALNAAGFRALRTVEVVLRTLEVAPARAGGAAELDALLAAAAAGGRKRRDGGGSGAAAAGGSKRPRAEGKGGGDGGAEGGAPAEEAGAAAAGGGAPPRAVVFRPAATGRGHTGYLTFGRKAVAVAAANGAPPPAPAAAPAAEVPEAAAPEAAAGG